MSNPLEIWGSSYNVYDAQRLFTYVAVNSLSNFNFWELLNILEQIDEFVVITVLLLQVLCITMQYNLQIKRCR